MKKLRSRRGFSLAEMLIAVLLLGFVSCMVTVITSVVLNTTNAMADVSQAEILGAEVLDNLARELRLANKVYFGAPETSHPTDTVTDPLVNAGEVLYFDRSKDDTEYSFRLDDDGMIYVGKVTKEAVDEAGTQQEAWRGDYFFAGVAYGNGTLRIPQDGLQFTQGLTGDNELLVIISVTINSGENSLWSGSLTVKPLGGAV